MIWGLLFCALGALYPPDDCILLQNENKVILRWPAGASSYALTIYKNGRLHTQRTVHAPGYQFQVQPGSHYLWTVTPEGGAPSSHSFSLPARPEYHADAAEGSGEPGGTVQARLQRRADGMNLWIDSGKDHLHYLFVTPGLRFTISARGGSGHPPLDPSGSQEGTPGGWGGRIEITTASAPWRDYLILDVRGGRGGQGDPGPKSIPVGDGYEGQPGKPGKVVTKIRVEGEPPIR